MEKCYKKFYSVGNNRYYTLQADDELFIATSTFIKVARKFKFLKTEITQGLKLLKMTTPIVILFDMLTGIKFLEKQKYDADELLSYEQLDTGEVKLTVETAYNVVAQEQEKLLQEWLDTMYEEVRKKITVDGEYSVEELEEKTLVFRNRYKQSLDTIKKNNPLNNGQIDLKTPKGNKIITSMINSGIDHLYTEPITGFMSNVYMYHIDIFAKITIYRVITVKNVVQTIDTFIYDQKLVKKLMKHLKKTDKSKERRK